jgi:hypothetical protein
VEQLVQQALLVGGGANMNMSMLRMNSMVQSSAGNDPYSYCPNQ